MILAILTLILAVGCFAIRELYNQAKLKWQDESKPMSFWGERSDLRKYAYPLEEPPNTWYYKFNSDLKHKERFPLSGTWLVLLTDGLHQFQFWMFNFLSASFTLALGWNWWVFGAVMIGIRLANWGARKLFIKSN